MPGIVGAVRNCGWAVHPLSGGSRAGVVGCAQTERGWPGRPASAGGRVPASRDKIRHHSLGMNWGVLQEFSCNEFRIMLVLSAGSP